MISKMWSVVVCVLACKVYAVISCLSLEEVSQGASSHVFEPVIVQDIVRNMSSEREIPGRCCLHCGRRVVSEYTFTRDHSDRDMSPSVIVHLFEWRFSEIARECEEHLSVKGFGAVQTSPITENVAIQGNPWWDRYQPISYKIAGRSGDETAFREMVQRCNAVSVKIYVDVVFNHMTSSRSNSRGVAGSEVDARHMRYPAIPFTPEHFHRPACLIRNYQSAEEVRNCQLLGMHDLDQTSEHVRGKIVEFLNYLIDFGVAGFRIDAAKHMWPSDLQVIFSRLNNLSTAHGFLPNTRPFIYQEVIDLGGEGISINEYTPLALVTEFKHSVEISRVFLGANRLKWLKNWGSEWSFVDSRDALVFVDNHDNQRGIASGRNHILTHKKPKLYKMANAFMLAHPYGRSRIMSSYAFTDENMGPPAVGPFPTIDGVCSNGWVCEHRWPQISNMVAFRNTVGKEGIQNWWDNNFQQIAFSRGNKGFVAFTLEGDLHEILQTGLPAGAYCDIISGSWTPAGCTGKTILVNDNGFAYIQISAEEPEAVLAIHIKAKLSSAEEAMISYIQQSFTQVLPI